MSEIKTVLGLDLGTNSIGWALVKQDFENKQGNILGMGSRIIPMTQDVLGNFEAGGSHSQTANRTQARSTRKLYQRDNLRRERLHRVLNILNFLPEHYKTQIDFITHKGQFINHSEPKLPYFKNHDGKNQFLFEDSFNEMVEEFRKTQPQLFIENKKIPYDWTIYYLRKKALSQKISREELAWLILHFNQKRGYYQLSEQDEIEDKSKVEAYHNLKIVDIIDTKEKNKKGHTWYHVVLENGWIYPRPSDKPLNGWISTYKEFIVTTEYNEDGSEKLNKDGQVKRSFRSPSPDDWGLLKKKTEFEIEKSQKTTGEFIYDALLQNPVQKIRGKLVKTIERKYYKAELEKILKTQIGFQPELKNKELYEACCMELYPNNDAHRLSISSRDFLYLFIKDIIFYQRPLKTKTHLISDCELEFRVRFDTQEKVKLKCIAKSNPIFQEFRSWQFIANLRILEKEKGNNGEDLDVTGNYLDTNEKWVELFEFLDEKEDITQKQLLAKFKLKEDKFRWNFPEDKTYPCNETKAKIINRIKRIDGLKELRLSKEQLQHLWHLLYSVTDPEEREKSLKKFSDRNGFNDEFTKSFSKIPPFKKDYGSYSEKAIKKLLPLMRRGKFWNESEIPKQAIDRIVDIENRLNSIEYNTNELEKVADDLVSKAVLKSFIKTNGRLDALNTYQASYLVYGIHSESKDTEKWESSSDIQNYLKNEFKQHSLRNPIVEQVLTETLRVVKDIWDEFGNGEKGFFSEVHIELGREMKNDASTRKRISDKVTENENTNQRIKAILTELMNEGVDVRPYSPSQQEILKIYEEGRFQSENDKEKLIEIERFRKNNSPTKQDINRYKLWLGQGYISPYTGKSIMLSELFSPKYQIEHIFPQSRFFDDSMSNKIICEAEVNQLKDNLTAFEFIEKFGGTVVQIGGGKNVKIFDLDAYQKHILYYFAKNKTKRENLLSKEIPEKFLNRQLNDSRYISKAVKGLLSKIVREDGEVEATSKHITTISGSITSQMKQDWGLNDVWNDIIKPRFQRMNELTNSSDFGYINPNTNKFLPKVPDELAKGFNKKRIDHRHHALDALVIACVTKDHVNYITSINTERKNYLLYSKLRKVEEIDKTITLPDGTTKIEKRKVAKDYLKPWNSFTQDVRMQLEKTVVSFKQNTRVINKTKNKFLKWVNTESGRIEKQFVPQTKGENWAIRKSLHKATIYGKVTLKREGKTFEATAGRVTLSDSFTRKQLDKITDTGIQKILNNHVKKYNENFAEAFSPEGVEALNANIQELNNGKPHQPIYTVRIYEVGNKFPVGTRGAKSSKYVEADKGTNLFFAIYRGKNKKGEEVRYFETIPLNVAIEEMKQGGEPAKPVYFDNNKCQYNLLFTLSPNDLVYVPTKEEMENPSLVDFKNLSKSQVERIYKMVSSTSYQCFFIRNEIANIIKDKVEFSLKNKFEKNDDGILVKSICWKLIINRLGQIEKVIF
jgi:CRISPR-associated endonuclease Csn1